MILLTLSLAGSSLASGEFAWHKEFGAAKAQAKKQAKPILVYFTTDWCGYCKVMEKETFPKADVQKQSQKYVAVKLDAEKSGKALAGKYKVNSYPTFVMVDSNDKEIGRIIGYKTSSDFMTRIEQILGGKATVADLSARLKANPQDGEAHLQMSLMMLGEGKVEDAAKHFESAKASNPAGPTLAKVHLEFGKLYMRSNFKKASEYLEASLALNEKSTQGEAYESLMMATLYGNQPAESLKVAERMAKDPLSPKETAAKGANYLRHNALGIKTASPDLLFTHLVSQLQGVEGKRDRFDFEGMFLDNAYNKILMVNPNLGVLSVEADKTTWHDALAYDKLKVKLIEKARSIDTQDNVTTGWVECDTTMTLPDGKMSEGRVKITLTLMKSGTRWMIVSMLSQALPPR